MAILNFPADPTVGQIYTHPEAGEYKWNGYAWERTAGGVVEGPVGPTGPQGPAGADGPAGAEGLSAYEVAVTNGYPGTEAEWVASLEGPAGADGAAGAQGIQGEVGPAGPAGADGAQGIQGEVGPQGPAGADGAVGPQGPAGADGAPGAQGPAGANGLDGAPGPQGPAGANGLDGAAGPQGPGGPQGPEGPMGPQGPQGPSGGASAWSGVGAYGFLRVTSGAWETACQGSIIGSGLTWTGVADSGGLTQSRQQCETSLGGPGYNAVGTWQMCGGTDIGTTGTLFMRIA
jgi:hypothetical protein